VLPTLVGIFFLGYFLVRRELLVFPPFIEAFTCGVIFACAAFLLLPEALHLASVDLEEEEGFGWWGSALLAGWLSCLVIHHASIILFGKSESPNSPSQMENGPNPSTPGHGDGTDPTHTKNGEVSKPSERTWSSMLMAACPVLFGDALHNASDGLVIGVAFKSCSTGFAWILIGVTIAHELPKELGDFVILVQRAGMKWYWALLSNFLSGMTTVVTAFIAYGIDISSVEGVLLAYVAGVYIFVAITELGPGVSKLVGTTTKENVAASFKQLFGFIVGCIAIGLVLLGHEHCGDEHGEGDDVHAGHNH